MTKKNPVTNRSISEKKKFEMNMTLEERQARLEGMVAQLDQRMTKIEEDQPNTNNNGDQKLKWILQWGLRPLIDWFSNL